MMQLRIFAMLLGLKLGPYDVVRRRYDVVWSNIMPLTCPHPYRYHHQRCRNTKGNVEQHGRNLSHVLIGMLRSLHWLKWTLLMLPLLNMGFHPSTASINPTSSLATRQLHQRQRQRQ
jgi:hypothetical protein